MNKKLRRIFYAIQCNQVKRYEKVTWRGWKTFEGRKGAIKSSYENTRGESLGGKNNVKKIKLSKLLNRFKNLKSVKIFKIYRILKLLAFLPRLSP